MYLLKTSLDIEIEKVQLQPIWWEFIHKTYNLYVLPGWEESAADGRVLWDAMTKRIGLVVPRGRKKIILHLYKSSVY